MRFSWNHNDEIETLILLRRHLDMDDGPPPRSPLVRAYTPPRSSFHVHLLRWSIVAVSIVEGSMSSAPTDRFILFVH